MNKVEKQFVDQYLLASSCEIDDGSKYEQYVLSYIDHPIKVA